MADNSDSTGCFWLAVAGLAAWWYFGGRDCDKYASEFSCSYVENDAEYEVWYWRDLESDDGADNILIGKAKGIEMCARSEEQTSELPSLMRISYAVIWLIKKK